MSRPSLALWILVPVAIASTALLGVHLAMPNLGNAALQDTTSTVSNSSGNSVVSQTPLQFLLRNSPVFSTASWAMVGGVWIWRGKVKSRWESLGFDSGVFDLFMKMKGARTRLNLLEALAAPKDRLQLANDLGLDWKAVDYHIVTLSRLGLVHEDQAFGRVKIYRLTTLGEGLLRLLKEFNRDVDIDADRPSTVALEELEKPAKSTSTDAYQYGNAAPPAASKVED